MKKLNKQIKRKKDRQKRNKKDDGMKQEYDVIIIVSYSEINCQFLETNCQ